MLCLKGYDAYQNFFLKKTENVLILKNFDRLDMGLVDFVDITIKIQACKNVTSVF